MLSLAVETASLIAPGARNLQGPERYEKAVCMGCHCIRDLGK